MKKLLSIAFALILAPMSVLATDFQEGTHYTTFSQAPSNGAPQVTEFFSFYCGHCYNFEKNFVGPIKDGLSDGVKFEQYHVDFIGGPMGVEMARAFAVAKVLKVEDRIKLAMFSAIHDAQKQFATQRDIKSLYADNGIAEADYDKAAASFMVNAMMKQWKKAQTESGVRGVPAMMVNNKYLVNTGSVSSLDELTELLNYLAAK
ncbi:thiol:disulfide interchange protein DsbA/DsbL [Ferrimonas gelatinilytica]|uniref:Thiol:disulfide interchange protein n=1 Tax=Ferrimonas gelatinilytica TaxID=1255257 RepID=A0ABP9RTK5_9GAMM